MDTVELTNSIKNRAMSLFDLVGVSPAGPFPENQFYKEWLAKGHAGDMSYMGRNPEKREDLKSFIPGSKSVISCGLNYNTGYPYSTEAGDKRKGWIARYAWGDDYHEEIQDRLNILCRYIDSITPGEPQMRLYVDTGPVLERTYAKYAGIGWIGKNTCLINQEIGSWIFIGEIITSLELEYDSPAPERCGTCTKCIDKCPTDAIKKPYELDSRLCISYLTIELRDKIPVELRDAVGKHVFGCDICQDVCPWNRRAETTADTAFQPREGLYNPELSALAGLDTEEFRALFKGSPVKRAKRRGLLRNTVVAIGNSGDSEFIPIVEDALGDEEPLVRAHAVWALYKIQGRGALNTLLEHKKKEPDQAVIDEIELIIRNSI
jgi:epoxyqueuosine reductase